MPDYENHSDVVLLLGRAQDADEDLREAARDAKLFTCKRDGQWEPYWWDQHGINERPRYTFDMTTPIINQICGEMEKSDFNIQVRPSGGEATKDIARTYDGLIRNIETISNATAIYNAAGRSMITGGLDGWYVKSDYADSDSFDQDLIIEAVPNFIDRVWFDDNSQIQDRSNSKWGFLLHVLTLDAYKEQFGDQREDGPPTASSVDQGRQNTAFWRKPSDQVIVADFYYQVEEKTDLVLMSNNQIFKVDKDFNAISDEMEALGITVKRRRTIKEPRFYVRKMDGADWLGEPQRTVFKQIPLIPTYGNFQVFENKIIFYGAVEKLLDTQRVLNYSKSREIEEGALAPRSKYWMTNLQMAGWERSLGKMNVSNAPVQGYTHDPDIPGPPQQNGGAQINPGLNDLSQTMMTLMQQQSGLFAANMGDDPNQQSGVAIEKLQNKGDSSTIHYWSSQEIAICQTAKLLIDAIPEVYDTERQVRMLNEDGSFEMVALNEPILDEQTGQMITLNDLSKGLYDVTCNSGPAFKNRQDQTLSSMLEIAAIMPQTLEQGSDIIFNAMDDPGADQMAERMRLQLFDAGIIPEEQMTDEEKQKMQEAQEAAANQPPPEDPMMVAAQAEQAKADAEMQKVQISGQKNELEMQKIQLKAQENQMKLMAEQQKLELAEQKLQLEGIVAQLQEERQSDMHDVEIIRQSAETLKIMREAMGVDGIMSPEGIKTYMNQMNIVEDQQKLLEQP